MWCEVFQKHSRKIVCAFLTPWSNSPVWCRLSQPSGRWQQPVFCQVISGIPTWFLRYIISAMLCGSQQFWNFSRVSSFNLKSETIDLFLISVTRVREMTSSLRYSSNTKIIHCAITAWYLNNLKIRYMWLMCGPLLNILRVSFVCFFGFFCNRRILQQLP